MRSGSALLALAVLLIPAAAQAQDVAAGEKAFAPCRSCHQIGPTAKNAVGPAQNGLIGRKAGTYPGYAYSDANKNSGLTWDEETFRRYIKDPKGVVPGTKMAYPGIKEDQKITDLIAFLKQYDDKGNKVTQ